MNYWIESKVSHLLSPVSFGMWVLEKMEEEEYLFPANFGDALYEYLRPHFDLAEVEYETWANWRFTFHKGVQTLECQLSSLSWLGQLCDQLPIRDWTGYGLMWALLESIRRMQDWDELEIIRVTEEG
jgi:hypothetical protein